MHDVSLCETSGTRGKGTIGRTGLATCADHVRHVRLLRKKRDKLEVQSVPVLPVLPVAHVTPFSPVSLVDHSNRRTTVIQRGPVGSIDGLVAIAEHRTVLVEPRLQREIDSDRFGF